jgi:phospholipid/cholesterol/gamma-HCH transport system substrate-binding protein
MESKVNYTLVGFFIVVLTISLVSFVFWMGKYGKKEQQFDYYTVYTNDTISGLNIQSPVKFKGLDVGIVKDISIDPNNSEQIKIELEIKKYTPIKVDTMATVALQGITGLKYIELLNGSKDAKLIQKDKDGNRVIKYGQNMFDKLGNTAQDMTTKANLVLTQLTLLLNDKNLKSVENILANVDKSSADLKTTLHNIDKLTKKIELIVNQKNANHITKILSNVEDTTQNLNAGTQFLDDLINKDLKATMDVVKTAATQTEDAFNKFELLIEDGEMDIKDMTDGTLKKMDSLFIEFKRAMQALENTLEDIEQNPQDLLFKETKQKFGPGEKQ